ncbi:ABC1 kinase family protein [Pigmentibacter ruber]|uniref:ABC1 kinase family protein n=1 Tax=Pigmentibacter ruber TaxID=2683196 RepID=UPI00131CDA46|nr:AarF/ABC1/UbiB kinase family protein [Pigmentibacter ruber]BFD31859.1 AarF/ABC1/UbiB kinase family protein [Pigmentibacter ruber]
MKKDNDAKTRALSLIKTISSTAVKAGNEAIKRKLNLSAQSDTFMSEAALRLVKGLDELKGAAMKVGQLLSMVDDNILPPGWKDALSKLQSQATAKDWEFIEPIMLKEFKDLSFIKHIDKKAVHAASIGQVHKAELIDGRIVAFKVQYPNLEKNVHSDLQNMKKVVKIANLIPNMSNYDKVFDAVEKLFIQELDFFREQKFYDIYHEKFKNNPNIVVPKTIPEYCRKNILTTEWVDAISLQEWMKQNESQLHNSSECIYTRDKLGSVLLELVFTEVFHFKHIQSDPNPGNFLVTTSGQLVLLDFGATQELSEELIENYASLTLAAIHKDNQELIKVAKKMGFLHRHDPPEAKDSFIKLMEIAIEPFLEETYSWMNSKQLKRTNAESIHFMKATKFRAPNSEVLFINRRLGGNLLIMESLGPTVQAKNILLNILQKKE